MLSLDAALNNIRKTKLFNGEIKSELNYDETVNLGKNSNINFNFSQ